MRNIYQKTVFIIVFQFVFVTILKCQSISGIVNSYAAVLSYDSCQNNCVNVNTVSGFSVGDYVLVIQMKGMRINETNTSSFGTFVSYDSCGFYEKAIIASISGTQICFTNDLAYTYKVSGKIQVVKIARYPTGVTISGTVTAPAWNGSTGGIVAIETSGTLTLNANIDVSGKGFRGGRSGGAITNSCNAFTNSTDYATDSTTWEFKSFKGEGVAEYIANKWSSRGPQASGGGGGNDHNSGGGGGAHLSAGGIGGRNNEPGTFNCKGYNPGMAGLGLNNLPKERLFLGSGGGSGHQNNAVNFAGGNGGGIVYVRANTIVGNNNWIKSNGDSSRMGGQDGGSGGGAGGDIKLDVNTYSTTLNISANGGRGASTNNSAINRCFGPGGGGSGGAVRLKSTSIPAGVLIQTLAGAPGVVFNSSNACNGSSNSATAGNAGVVKLSSSSIFFSRSGITRCRMARKEDAYHFYSEQRKDQYIQYLQGTTLLEGDVLIIEKSLDGFHFEQTHTLRAQVDLASFSYEFPDNIMEGSVYYKARIVRAHQTLFESEIVYYQNQISWTSDDIVIAPNPTASNKTVQIWFPSLKGQLQLELYNLSGQYIANYSIAEEKCEKGYAEIRIPQLQTGLFLLRFVSPSGVACTKKILVVD